MPASGSTVPSASASILAAEAEWDMDDVAGVFEYYAGLAEALEARQDQRIEVPMEASS